MTHQEGTEHDKLSDQSGVSVSMLWNWFYGATRRPQFATVAAVVRSMGYELEITEAGEKVIQLAPHRQRRTIVEKQRSAAATG